LGTPTEKTEAIRIPNALKSHPMSARPRATLRMFTPNPSYPG